MNINEINHDVNAKVQQRLIEELEKTIIKNKKYKPVSFKDDIASFTKNINIEKECEKVIVEVINKYDNLGGYDIKISRDQYKEQFDEMVDKTTKIYREMPQQVAKDFTRLNRRITKDIESGKITKDQALKQIKKSYGGNTITYANGNKMPFEKYLSMLYTTNLTRSLEFRSRDIANTLNTDFYEYSEHTNPRDACSSLQGQIVTYGKPQYIVDQRGARIYVLSLGDHGYGTASGALGINCKHYMFPFVPGVSRKIGKHTNIIEEVISFE